MDRSNFSTCKVQVYAEEEVETIPTFSLECSPHGVMSIGLFPLIPTFASLLSWPKVIFAAMICLFGVINTPKINPQANQWLGINNPFAWPIPCSLHVILIRVDLKKLISLTIAKQGTLYVFPIGSEKATATDAWILLIINCVGIGVNRD